MKKKIYFSISAILQIIILLIVILNAETLVNQSIEQVKEMYSAFPIEFQEEVIENLENSGVTMVIVQSAISIVLNLFVFITALENKVLVKKGKIIATSVVNFFLANN